MTIHFPKDVENSVEAAMNGGFYASVEDALTEAWRSFQRQHERPQTQTQPAETIDEPLLGSIRDYANEVDEIVADAMKRRQEVPWRGNREIREIREIRLSRRIFLDKSFGSRIIDGIWTPPVAKPQGLGVLPPPF